MSKRTVLLDFTDEGRGRQGEFVDGLKAALNPLRREGVLLPLEARLETEGWRWGVEEQWQRLLGSGTFQLSRKRPLEQVLILFRSRDEGSPRERSRVPQVLEIWKTWIDPIFSSALGESMRDAISEELIIRFVSVGRDRDDACTAFEREVLLEQEALARSAHVPETVRTAIHDPLSKQSLNDWTDKLPEYSQTKDALNVLLGSHRKDRDAADSKPYETALEKLQVKLIEYFDEPTLTAPCLPKFKLDRTEYLAARDKGPREQEKLAESIIKKFISTQAQYYFGLPGLEIRMSESFEHHHRSMRGCSAFVELLHLDLLNSTKHGDGLIILVAALCNIPAVREESKIHRVASIRDGYALELRVGQVAIEFPELAAPPSFGQIWSAYISRLRGLKLALNEATAHDSNSSSESSSSISEKANDSTADTEHDRRSEIKSRFNSKVKFGFLQNFEPDIEDESKDFVDELEAYPKEFGESVENQREALAKIKAEARVLRAYLPGLQSTGDAPTSPGVFEAPTAARHWSDQVIDEGRALTSYQQTAIHRGLLRQQLATYLSRQCALKPCLISSAFAFVAVAIGWMVASVSFGIPKPENLLMPLFGMIGGVLLVILLARWQCQNRLGKRYRDTLHFWDKQCVDRYCHLDNTLIKASNRFQSLARNGVNEARNNREAQEKQLLLGRNGHYSDHIDRIIEVVKRDYLLDPISDLPANDDFSASVRDLLTGEIRPVWRLEIFDLELSRTAKVQIGDKVEIQMIGVRRLSS